MLRAVLLLAAAAAAAEDMQYLVGVPEYVAGPDPDNFDSPLTALVSDGVVRAYSANQNTFLVAQGPSVNATLDPPLAVGLGPGNATTDLDSCGSWLNAVVVGEPASGTVHGFYHQETGCDYARNFFTNKSIAYAESVDGGRTFIKPGHPQNAIIVPPLGNTTVVHQTGEGDHGVAASSDFLYLLFTEWDPPGDGWTTVGLARASRQSGGRPGAWFKYRNGNFSEPGVHGESDAIANVPGTAIYFRNATQDFVAVGLSNPATRSGGVFVAFSADAINWALVNESLFPYEPSSWNRSDPSVGELVAYPALSGTLGSADVQASFFLYYTYLAPGATFASRYLTRRWIAARALPSPNAPRSLVALAAYQNQSGAGLWATTALVTPALANFTQCGTLGALASNAPSSILGASRPLFDCFIPAWNDHMVAFPGECGIAPLRTLGWAMQQPSALAPIQLQRCFNNVTLKHGVTTTGACGGDLGTLEFTLGWLFPADFGNSNI